MKLTKSIAPGMILGLAVAGASVASGPARANPKNWTPPSEKIYAQELSDEIMKAHPDLQSVTFHGTPPGEHDIYTMFAGSYPERIGNQDDPDDVDVIKKGITLLDPRWNKPNDAVKRFVVQMPLRDKAGENIGLIVYAFKGLHQTSAGEAHYAVEAIKLRDKLQSKIPSYDALFKPAK